jgi:hypothetical protein
MERMLESPTSELLAIILLPMFLGLFWLFAATTFRAPSASERSRRYSANRFALLSITDAFDPDHAIVWQSQAPALRLIGRGVALSVLSEFFRHFSSIYPELFEGIAFDEWLRFLQASELVVRVGPEVRLTANGREFLDYLEQAQRKFPVR